MTETVVAVGPSRNPQGEAAAAAIDVPDARAVGELDLGRELVRPAREAGVALTGPGGLLKSMTRSAIKSALDDELSEHLGYDRNDPAGYGSGNSANGARFKTVVTDSCGSIDIDVPRDRADTFEPHIVSKRQRRLADVDEVILSLYTRVLTTGRSAAVEQSESPSGGIDLEPRVYLTRKRAERGCFTFRRSHPARLCAKASSRQCSCPSASRNCKTSGA